MAREGDRMPDLMDAVALDLAWLPRLSRACREREIEFLATPFDEHAVIALEKVGVPCFKIASSEINNFQLLAAVAKCRKPVILSTGMASLADIERAMECLESGGAGQVTLLRCTVAYPAAIEDANLLAMRTLREAFNCNVGFSDHTEDDISAVLAVGLGATVIEKHFTLDRNLPGPDHAFARTPPELSKYVESIRRGESALGSPRIRVAECERGELAYRSGLVLRRALACGEVLTEDAVVMKRPGWGIAPHELRTVLGHRVLRDLEEDHILVWSDFLA